MGEFATSHAHIFASTLPTLGVSMNVTGRPHGQPPTPNPHPASSPEISPGSPVLNADWASQAHPLALRLITEKRNRS
jgi:hypothetical protein